MTYREQLTPWVVYRLWPDLRAIAVAQFRQRNEAEEYVKTVRRMTPATARFAILFVPPLPAVTVRRMTPATARFAILFVPPLPAVAE